MGIREGEWIKYKYDGTLFLIISYKNGIEKKYDGIKIKPDLFFVFIVFPACAFCFPLGTVDL